MIGDRRAPDDSDFRARELYEVATDPFERRDRLAELGLPPALHDLLQAAFARDVYAASAAPTSAAQETVLAALGYADGDGTPP